MNHQALNIDTSVTQRQTALTRRGVGSIMVVFIISLLIPGNFDIAGTITLNASRLLMLAAIIPLFLAWLSGKAGRIILPDILIAAVAIWMLVSFIYNHGTERIPFGIITGIELFGGYLMGRVLVRSPGEFKKFFSYMVVVYAILFPFAIYELATSNAIIQSISRSLLGISHGDVNHPPRWGLWRVQSVMMHPILFGVFCALAVANIFYIWKDYFFQWLPRVFLALFLTMTSLSSGPLLAAASQIGIIFWGWITGNRWMTLLCLFMATYIFLSIASNRGPIILLIDTLTFSSATGWTRVHIFNHGIDNVWANPVFGLGLREWTRPTWLTSSVDNFWLVVAMRHGIIGFGLLATALFINLWNIIRAKNLSEVANRYRTGYVIGLIGLCFSLATVHVWGPTYVLTMFYFGAGAWLVVQTPETVRPTAVAAPSKAHDMRLKLPLRRSAPVIRARSAALAEESDQQHYARDPAREPSHPYRKN